MSFETVKYELSESTAAIITMNRPEALNALSLQLTERFTFAAIEKAVEDTGSRRRFDRRRTRVLFGRRSARNAV